MTIRRRPPRRARRTARPPRTTAALCLAFALLAAVAAASRASARPQDATIDVPVIVTSATGRDVYLDKGATSGLAVGMTVTLQPANRAAIIAPIVAVSSTSARAEVPAGDPVPLVGTPGTVTVPKPDDVVVPPRDDRGAGGEGEQGRTAPPAGDTAAPEHPPWRHPGFDPESDQPLLGRVYRQPLEERPTTLRGRVFGSYDLTLDRGGERDRAYHRVRFGTRLEVTNPFGKGGRLAFDGEVDHRRTEIMLGFGEEESTTRLDIDRLSYAYGGQDYAPYRVEFGRFHPLDLPELGPMDGAEFTLQFDHGFRAGVGAGSYLRPFQSRASGEDLGFHVFLDYQAPARSPGARHLSATVAFQHTWHEGESDRDLILARVNYRPFDTLWLFASCKLDVYTDDDPLKTSGIDLTELYARATWTPSGTFGGSVGYSHYEWVSVQRREFEDIVDEIIAEGEVDRADARAWWRVRPDLRLSARVGLWEDQVGDGTNGELSADYTPKGWPVGLDGGVYFTDARHLEGIGYRARVTMPLDAGRAHLGYDEFQFERHGFGGTGDEATRRVVRGGVDFSLGTWTYNLYGDLDFGDDEDGLRLGLYMSHRF